MRPTTKRAFEDDIELFASWCDKRDLTSYPASPSTVCEFIRDMATTRKPASVKRYVSHISANHRSDYQLNPALSAAVKREIKEMVYKYGSNQKQAFPLHDGAIAQMILASGTTIRHLRDKALLSLAYSTLARRSELAAMSISDLSSNKSGWGRITVGTEATLRTQATDSIRYVPPDCMAHVNAWILAAKIKEGRLFRAVAKGGRVRDSLDAGDIPTIYRTMAKAAGLPPEMVKQISGHSTRVGGACDLARYGQQLPAIMQAGGWRHYGMPTRYSTQAMEGFKADHLYKSRTHF